MSRDGLYNFKWADSQIRSNYTQSKFLLSWHTAFQWKNIQSTGTPEGDLCTDQKYEINSKQIRI